MKITYLELLNLIKEDKQPKEIIYNGNKYIWQEYDYYLDTITPLSKIMNYCTRSQAFVPIIEIIEEDKPIEKLEVADYIQQEHREMIFKINEIIDYINKEKEGD